MITFKQFLEESRSAPLYHGTNNHSATEILKSNSLRSSYFDEEDSISFTRDLNFAKRWVLSADKNAYQELDASNVVVFEVDQQKLNQRYKISPFNFFDDKTRRRGHDNKRNEYEERVNNRVIKDFDRYITKIIILVKPGKRIKDNILLNHPKLYYNGKFVNK